MATKLNAWNLAEGIAALQGAHYKAQSSAECAGDRDDLRIIEERQEQI